MPSSSACGLSSVERVPAHVRNFQVGSRGAIGFTSPAIQPKPSGDIMFEPAGRHELHADADAEERLAAGDDLLLQRLAHAGNRHQSDDGNP